MTNPRRALGSAADPPNGSKDPKDSKQPSNAGPGKPTNVNKVNAKPSVTIERYLDEAPNAGGATYGLAHGSRHRNVLNVLAVVDTEFGGDKWPN